MIMVATNKNDVIRMTEMLKSMGYEHTGYLWNSQEWRKDDEIIFLHKGYDKEGRTLHEWGQKTGAYAY